MDTNETQDFLEECRRRLTEKRGEPYRQPQPLQSQQEQMEEQRRQAQVLLLQQQSRRRRLQADSVGHFLRAQSGYCYDLGGSITSQALYAIYCCWCETEQIIPEPMRTLCYRLKHSPLPHPVRAVMLLRDGRHCRGFRGMRATGGADETDDTQNTHK